jgi:hypothetical protein
LIDALERYIDDSDCLIFLKILQGEFAEEVRDDQLHLLVEIPRVMEEEDCALHSGVPSGMLQIASFMRILKKLLNTKSDHSFNKLQKALQFEAKKGRMIAYNEIFEEDEDGNQGDFCELLRAQHLEEIIAYGRKLKQAIEDRADKVRITTRMNESMAAKDVVRELQNNPLADRSLTQPPSVARRTRFACCRSGQTNSSSPT